MDLNARWLKTNSLVRKELNDEVKNTLSLIKDSILYSSRSGTTYIDYPLPTIYPLIPLENHLCKLYIYSNIIKKIKEKEFDIKMIINDKKCIIIDSIQNDYKCHKFSYIVIKWLH